MDIILKRILDEIGTERGAKAKFLQALNLPSSMIGDWTSGKNKSYTKKIAEISNYFNVSADYLLGLTDYKELNTTVEHSQDQPEQKEKPVIYNDEREENLAIINEYVKQLDDAQLEKMEEILDSILAGNADMNKLYRAFRFVSDDES